MKQIGIVGGGAAGLIAAIFAARRGHAVTILERMDRVGKKILSTGNGRCNITNRDIALSHYHGEHIEDICSAFSLFSLEDTLNFFEEIGIDVVEKEQGKLYPRSLQATSVLDNLRYECARLGVVERCKFEVKTIQKQGKGFLVTSYQNETQYLDCVIITTGGKASSQLGSNGTGYDLAKSMGHHVGKLFPALTKIKAAETFLKSISGVKVDGTVTIEGNVSQCDEILFTDNGLSGPAVFAISRQISERIHRKEPTKVWIDLFPDLSQNDLFMLLMRRFNQMPYKMAAENLIGFLPKKLIFPILKTADIDKRFLSSAIDKSQINALCRVLKSWEFHVEKVAPFAEAQVCCGGIDTREIDKNTMESRLCPGLFFAGEILDVDGDCGGFNLQWAWTSGAIAGQNV